MAQFFILPSSTPRRMDDSFHNPTDALICPLVVVCANDIGAVNPPTWERTSIPERGLGDDLSLNI